MVPAKANENKHVFHCVTPLWIIINILFPILCNFGIIQIYALAWVGGFASGNWHYISKAQKEENMSIIFTHFQTEGDNRTSSSIVCPPSSCRVSFEVRGCWRIWGRKCGWRKGMNIIRSDSHNQALCHINHWVSWNEGSFIIIFTFRFIPRSNTSSNNILGIF